MSSLPQASKLHTLFEDHLEAQIRLHWYAMKRGSKWQQDHAMEKLVVAADVAEQLYLEELTHHVCRLDDLNPEETGPFNSRPNAPANNLADLAGWLGDVARKRSHGQYSPIHSLQAPANDPNPVKERIAEQFERARTLMASRNQPMAAE